MADTIQDAKLTGFAAYLPEVAKGSIETYRAAYEENRHRVYSLAFWMTDNEMEAEELLGTIFRRAFAMTGRLTPEVFDRTLLAEVRELMPVGCLTLECPVSTEVADIRSNTKRVHLERAVVQLPATERLIYLLHDGEGYKHLHVSQLLGITETESRNGLHQARLRIRELVAAMK